MTASCSWNVHFLSVQDGHVQWAGFALLTCSLLFPGTLDPGIKPRCQIKRQQKQAVLVNGRAVACIWKMRPLREVSPCKVPALVMECGEGRCSSLGTFLLQEALQGSWFRGSGPVCGARRPPGAPPVPCSGLLLLTLLPPLRLPLDPYDRPLSSGKKSS